MEGAELFSAGDGCTQTAAVGAAGGESPAAGTRSWTGEPRSEPSQTHSDCQWKSSRLGFMFVWITMAAGLHNDVLLAALQYFVLLAHLPPLAVPPSSPTAMLRG